MDGFHGAFLVRNISSVVKKVVKKVIWGARGSKHKLCKKLMNSPALGISGQWEMTNVSAFGASGPKKMMNVSGFGISEP